MSQPKFLLPLRNGHEVTLRGRTYRMAVCEDGHEQDIFPDDIYIAERGGFAEILIAKLIDHPREMIISTMGDAYPKYYKWECVKVAEVDDSDMKTATHRLRCGCVVEINGQKYRATVESNGRPKRIMPDDLFVCCEAEDDTTLLLTAGFHEAAHNWTVNSTERPTRFYQREHCVAVKKVEE